MKRRLLNEEFELLREKLKKLELLSDENRLERIEKSKKNFSFFAMTYFPHLLEAKPSRFHRWFFDRMNELKPGSKILIAAPRGNAKTTLARLLMLWHIIRGDIHFAVVISDTVDQAKASVEAIKIELEENPRLSKDFSDCVGEGPVWQAEEIVTKNRIKIKCYGSGKRIRGANYRGFRPELIVLDDLENDENVRTKEQRDKLHLWFERSIVYLGPPDASAKIIYIGTILHYDSLMQRVAKRGDFEFHKWRALISYPSRMDLWEKWENIWREDPVQARYFYETHKAEMDEGAEVLWPDVQTLYDLMLFRAASPATFAAEMQNEPIDESLAVFKNFSYYTEPPRGTINYGAVDPALGKARGDTTAIIVVGRDPQTGKIYVLHADIGRYDPMRTIERMIQSQKLFNCVRWAVEDVAFQEFFRKIIVTISASEGVPLPVVGVKQRASKDIRIESLAPHVENGVILFHPQQYTLLEQLRLYPLADHDDGPDALEMAFRIAHSASPIEFRVRKTSRRGF